jgi:CRISPR-associated protein Cpf1
VFSKENLEKQKHPLLRLNGNAEVFYREAYKIEKEPVILERDGDNKIARRENKEVYHYQRYLEPKYLFHCLITLNASQPSVPKLPTYNKEINYLIKNKYGVLNVIGIDRGEKNLLYYCVIDKDQKILDYGSLNEINGVNYFEKLVEREKEREKNRQSWEPVTQIKDLKAGYLSYVIRKICDLIEKYNAVVVLEDLNYRFKQVRSGIERTIYQQFEKALINKLNYLSFKDNRDLDAPGGILNGYQLTAPFTSFQDIGQKKQTGILFYTNAEYTSKTDPLTGFRQNIYIQNSAPIKKIKDLIEKIKEIGWDSKINSYYFKYNAKDFGEGLDKTWKVYANVPRIRREKNNSTGYWEYKSVNPNELFEKLFKEYCFEEKDLRSNQIKEVIQRLDKNGDLNEKKLIKEIDSKKERNFYEFFIYIFNLILQIRNTHSLQVKFSREENKLEEIDYGIDFIASPVEPFFTTLGAREIGKEVNGKIGKEAKEKIAEERLTEFIKDRFAVDYDSNKKFDSDGVGAYNIARKGLILLERIKENPEKPELAISNKDWDKFVIKN